tara:strand:- start:1105 stop:2136 length:1032 start_codon:yes stop_codon:yes gene_type:complete
MADPTLQQIQQTTTTIPDYAKPYVEELLGSAQGLTDINQNPYMQYMGDRVAQFTPLQQQSYENAGLMQTAPQLQDASAMAGQAGLGALNTQYTYDPYKAQQFTGANVEQYMNPYMQNVVERQQQDAQRQSQIASQAQQAQAARSGAFGGSGDYLMRGQAAGNLARQKGDIQAQGLNNAYTQAMNQFNTSQGQNQAAAQLNAQQQQFGAGLGLQGLQTANQAATNLANIGQTQYGQNMGILGMQNQFGGQQQQQVQNVLNNQYGDFLSAQNHPYKQLGFMSDMLRGLPLTQQSQSMYGQAPSMVQQVAGLGITGKALGAFAGGGYVGSRPAGLAELALYRMSQD